MLLEPGPGFPGCRAGVRAVPPPPAEGGPGSRQLLADLVTGLVFLIGADGEATGPACAASCQGGLAVCPGAQFVDMTRCSQERQSDQSTPSTHRCQPCQSEGAATRARSSEFPPRPSPFKLGW